jgi:twitching motility two-component system response regulator PilG
MYGNLQEISIGKILQLIESEQRSGVLFVENSSLTTRENNIFIVFCFLGKITYAADHNSFSLIRIHDFLRHYQLENSLIELSQELIYSNNIPEYEAILLLGQKQILSNYQSKKILQSIIQETLFHLFLLSKGHFTWQENYKLQPQILCLKITPLVQKLNLQQQLWQQYYPFIKFSSQCPLIEDKAKLKATLREHNYSSLSTWMDGKTSLIQLSRYLNKDLVTMAKAIYPSIEMGWVKLLNNQDRSSLKPEKATGNTNIVYVTKDLDWTSSLSILLKNKNYKLLVISDLGEGFKMIWENLPSLVLLEMEDFQLNSDYFCKIIRSNKNLIDTPIIVITNHYRFIDNLKHKIAGATEYLTKSAIAKNLLNIIEKYLE